MELDTAVGVPLIAPVDVEMDNPAGRLGDIDHAVAASPLAVGVTVVIAVPFVKVNELGEYVIDDGAAKLISILIEAVELPPVFVAVTV